MSDTAEQKRIMKNGQIAGASRALYVLTESILRDHGECEARDALIAAALDAGVMPLLQERVARMTTPKPLSEAPTDKPVLGIWIDHWGKKCVEVLRWCGYWHGSDGTPLYREAEYLPLPVDADA